MYKLLTKFEAWCENVFEFKHNIWNKTVACKYYHRKGRSNVKCEINDHVKRWKIMVNSKREETIAWNNCRKRNTVTALCYFQLDPYYLTSDTFDLFSLYLRVFQNGNNLQFLCPCLDSYFRHIDRARYTYTWTVVSISLRGMLLDRVNL